MPQIFKILEDPFEGGILHCEFPDFRQDLVFSDTYNGLKFQFSAFSSLQVDRSGRKTEKKGKIISKSIGVNERKH